MQTPAAHTETIRDPWHELAQNAHQQIKDAEPATVEGRREMLVALGVMHAVEVITRPATGGEDS